MLFNKSRAAFTMIELVFVIVIIGILSAVAIPKLLNTTKEAHIVNVKSFVGTLNRTVGPIMWSESIADGKDGNISDYCSNVTYYTEVPDEVTFHNDCTVTLNNGSGASGVVTFLPGTSTRSPRWDYNATTL